MQPIGLPHRDEYADFYAGYIQRVPETDIVGVMESTLAETLAMLDAFGDEDAGTLKGTQQWTLKQVLGHLCDNERILSYRVLRIVRGDRTPLPGYEQDDYMREADFNQRSLQSLMDEYRTLRTATIALANTVTPELADRRGIANNNEVSARAIMYIIVGHHRNHLEAIRKLHPVRLR